MKIVVQRVTEASVVVNNAIIGEIKKGLLILLGIENADTIEDIEWLCNKIVNLRIFDDAAGVMNCSVKEVDGDILVISQFTLMASTKKGNRPSYILASKPDIAMPIYNNFIRTLTLIFGKEIEVGSFGADMKVSLINDGPVTLIIDSKNRV